MKKSKKIRELNNIYSSIINYIILSSDKQILRNK